MSVIIFRIISIRMVVDSNLKYMLSHVLHTKHKPFKQHTQPLRSKPLRLHGRFSPPAPHGNPFLARKMGTVKPLEE